MCKEKKGTQCSLCVPFFVLSLFLICVTQEAAGSASDVTDDDGVSNASTRTHTQDIRPTEGGNKEGDSHLRYNSRDAAFVIGSEDEQLQNPRDTSTAAAQVLNDTAQDANDTLQELGDQIIFSDAFLSLPVDVDFHNCIEGKDTQHEGELGEIHGWLRPTFLSTTTNAECSWRLQVPEHMYLSAVAEVTLDPCDRDFSLVVKDKVAEQDIPDILANLGCALKSQVVLASANVLYIEWTETESHRITQDRLVFKVRYQSTSYSLRNTFVVRTSPFHVSIASHGFDGIRGAPKHLNAIYYFTTGTEYLSLVSFQRFHLPGFYRFVVSGAYRSVDRRFYPGSTTRHQSTLVRITWGSLEYFKFTSDNTKDRNFYSGFKILVSFHPKSEVPQCSNSGQLYYYTCPYDCSVPHFATFKQHLNCNLYPQCLNGEDEGQHCPYRPPGCNDEVGYKTKCYTFDGIIDRPYGRMFPKFPEEAILKCEERGGSLATVTTRGEWDALGELFRHEMPQNNILIGMKSFEVPGLYKRAVRWLDGTIEYSTNFTFTTAREAEDTWMYVHFQGELEIGRYKRLYDHGTTEKSPYVCQFLIDRNSTTSKQKIHFPDSGGRTSDVNHSLIQCQEGHVTHVFLSCDPDSHCGAERRLRSCKLPGTESVHAPMGDREEGGGSVPMFVCDDDENTVHYSLVCDFREDCPDRSDENLCVRPECGGFTCSNGQCVAENKVCDTVWNCLDGSDENYCDEFVTTRVFRLPPPAVVDFQYDGLIVQRPLNASEPCPRTHFRCPGESNYCLPVYVRCNGVYDCVGHEDEADCENFTCPGFYRCRASPVCVHVDHLCDGMARCPQRDDEWLCGVKCPEGCRCHGLVFVCFKAFHANEHSELRYLDAAGSGMTPRDLTDNFHLVWLSLAACRLTVLESVNLPNLRTIDLSDNRVTSVSLAFIQMLPSLQVLSLAGNPLQSLIAGSYDSKQTNLKSIDLSFTLLKSFDSTFFSSVPGIQNLNISFGSLTSIADSGFNHVPALRTLDIRGSPLRKYPSDLFQRVTELQTLYVGNYELCCSSVLPEAFDGRFCYAPEDEISSCEDLLQSDVYRVFLWVITFSSVFGNVGSLVFRFREQENTSKLAFTLFVSSLCFADLLMGVYLFMIGTADLLYKDNYIAHKLSWTDSVSCKIAGFLSLLSSEVSAFMICLITLDRCIVLRFPFSVYHFQRLSATVACVIVWGMGILLAVIPLLPVTSHWDFYGQTGICIPLPITRKSYEGRDYAFGVMIVFNFVLFLLIAAGQAFVYWSVRINTMATDSTKKSQDLTIARRLITVAVTDFLCWFPIGLLGLMAATGVPVPGEFNVITAIFVLPLNSALNPFLYTYNVLAERRRKSREEELLKLLETQLLSE